MSIIPLIAVTLAAIGRHKENKDRVFDSNMDRYKRNLNKRFQK
jgi:hypothetical protein